jgi:hypothetical protein
MAYTICNWAGQPKPIRLLLTDVNDVPRLGEEFTPFWWVCDPCNPHSSRYEVTHGNGYQPQGYPWYQVVTSDDTADDVQLKLDHYAKVIEAKKALELARRDYERLNGGR